MDLIKAVLDVLGGRVAFDGPHARVVVLLAEGSHSAKGENEAMKMTVRPVLRNST